MIWFLLAAHVAGLLATGLSAPWLGRRVFYVAALPPLVTTVWAATQIGTSDPAEAEATWVAGLDLVFAFRVDALAVLMTLLVSGIGVFVFVYAAGYFSAGAARLGTFAVTLLGFSASMLGLVWSDSVWSFFIFWELTSVTSFLLVGYKYTDPVARLAARRALFLTVSGGLALLAGFVLFVDEAGSASLSELSPVTGTAASAAAVLLMAAAATKSAQVPFHVWLPGAMAAPTPVSAYLHSATMVKAGVLLVAVAAPALSETGPWTPLGVTLGLASMIWGGVGALRQVDAKLILAWGTVSQLGLMIALLSLGEAKATFAAVSMLLAHAVFKAALFMLVGEVDVRTGTRDIRVLSGLPRTMPIVCAATVAAGLSMAGAPPLLGFPAKEAAIEGVLGLNGFDGVVVTVTVVVGSVITVSYAVRLLLGMFGTSGEPTEVAPARVALGLPPALLSALGVVGFFALDAVNEIVWPAAAEVDPAAATYSLLRWPGLTDAFTISVAVLAGGAVVGWLLARRLADAPRSLGAEAVDRGLDGVVVLARRVTRRVQHGSLPVYVLTMAVTASLAMVPFVIDLDTSAVEWAWGLELLLGILVIAAALAASQVRSRLGAALALGAVGMAVSGLFLTHGAPDLALTQLLVETVIVVGFVVGLGRLRRKFPPTAQLWRTARISVSALLGLGVMAALATSAGSPSGEPAVEQLIEEAVADGGGNNVVNVILTDIRALDTFGEIAVLVVVAVGVLALMGRSQVVRNREEEQA